MIKYWIFKTEPSEFSIHDLADKGDKGEEWNGIRNYQARNFLRDKVKLNDQVLIYHSSCKEIGIAGLATVTKEAFPDMSAQNHKSKYFDEKACKENPRWYSIQLTWAKTFERILRLNSIKSDPILKDTFVANRNRLSVGEITIQQLDQKLKLQG